MNKKTYNLQLPYNYDKGVLMLKALERCATLIGILFAFGCTDRGAIM